jgi:hypothetical protein
MPLTVSARSIKPSPQTYWACARLWWKVVCVQGVRLSAFATLLAFLTLLTVSGPHLVHHLTELHPLEAQHTHDGQHTHDSQHTHDRHTPRPPDCHVLFSLQHTPVAESGIAVLPILLLAAEPLLVIPPLLKVEAPQYAFQPRAPPA